MSYYAINIIMITMIILNECRATQRPEETVGLWETRKRERSKMKENINNTQTHTSIQKQNSRIVSKSAKDVAKA